MLDQAAAQGVDGAFGAVDGDEVGGAVSAVVVGAGDEEHVGEALVGLAGEHGGANRPG
jgi:hypothetical protein